MECKNAGKEILDAVYIETEGDGYDLPYGCIWDATRPEKYFSYWNPNGVVISRDPKIRQICFDSGRLSILGNLAYGQIMFFLKFNIFVYFDS